MNVLNKCIIAFVHLSAERPCTSRKVSKLTWLGLLILWFAMVTDHSVYVGSMWVHVGVRILHIHSFFRKCFYSCLGSFLYPHAHTWGEKSWLYIGTQCTGDLDEFQQ